LVFVEWSVSDPSATVTVDGVQVTVNSDGTFSERIIISSGNNDIVVVASTWDTCTTSQTISINRRTGWGGGGSSRTGGSSPVCGNNIINFTEECDDGNRVNGDGCSATCNIEDEDIIEEIKKKKIITLIARRPEPYSFPEPAILAPTGHEKDARNYVKFVLEAYHNQTK
jgi:cysteine-rich repeat protein